MSSTFPIKGYPFGPGGYGSPAFRRRLCTRISEAAMASNTPPMGETENMGDGRWRRVSKPKSSFVVAVFIQRKPVAFNSVRVPSLS